MKNIYTISDPDAYREALEAASDILKRGGIAAIPTDTVYGFAALVTKPRSPAFIRSRSAPGTSPLLSSSEMRTRLRLSHTIFRQKPKGWQRNTGREP